MIFQELPDTFSEKRDREDKEIFEIKTLMFLETVFYLLVEIKYSSCIAISQTWEEEEIY